LAARLDCFRSRHRNKNFIESPAPNSRGTLPRTRRVEDHADPAEWFPIGGSARLHGAGASCMMRARNFIHSSV
jgi:hypothetical protein